MGGSFEWVAGLRGLAGFVAFGAGFSTRGQQALATPGYPRCSARRARESGLGILRLEIRKTEARRADAACLAG